MMERYHGHTLRFLSIPLSFFVSALVLDLLLLELDGICDFLNVH